MQPFSERYGYSAKKAIQLGSIDDALRNRIWNTLGDWYWSVTQGDLQCQLLSGSDRKWALFFRELCGDHLKWRIDIMPEDVDELLPQVASYFFKCEWWQVFDFIEFVVSIRVDLVQYDRVDLFIRECNQVLEQEGSGYRFVGRIIARITSEVELGSIDEAMNDRGPAASHIEKALALLSDRQSPDYRNSIKESISAVESLCRIVSGDSKATLGEALSTIEKQQKVALHPALRKAFEALYGYTSDEQGIRHSLLNESTLDFDDAKFFLVSCSAFVNYLKAKANKAGINVRV